MQVGELEGAREGEDEGDVVCGGGGGVFGEGFGGGEGMGWDAAGKGGVVVDVEFEEVVEGVGEGRVGAVDFCEGEWVSW